MMSRSHFCMKDLRSASKNQAKGIVPTLGIQDKVIDEIKDSTCLGTVLFFGIDMNMFD